MLYFKPFNFMRKITKYFVISFILFYLFAHFEEGALNVSSLAVSGIFSAFWQLIATTCFEIESILNELENSEMS